MIVDPQDPGALAQTIGTLIDQESTLESMGRAGREWYDIKRAAELKSLMELYDLAKAKPTL